MSRYKQFFSKAVYALRRLLKLQNKPPPPEVVVFLDPLK